MARRRGHGDGGIRRRPDGRWEACIELGAGNGRRPRKFIYGRTRAEVAEKLRHAQAELDAGMVLAHERVRVGPFLDRWLSDVIRPSRSFATWQGYEVSVRLHINPVIGRRPLAKSGRAGLDRQLVRHGGQLFKRRAGLRCAMFYRAKVNFGLIDRAI